MSFLSDSVSWLNNTLQESAGVSVTYTTPAGVSLSLTPWLGRTLFASNLQSAARVEWGELDFLIPVADLTSGGTAFEPAIGHRITLTIGGSSKVFEVMRPSTGEPAWRYSDPGQTVYRIHVKRVS